jgi:hypothetical protein
MLVDVRFRRMLGRLGCVGRVNTLPPLMCCRLCAPLTMLYLSAGSEVWSCLGLGVCVFPPLLFLMFLFSVGVACHLLGGVL